MNYWWVRIYYVSKCKDCDDKYFASSMLDERYYKNCSRNDVK